MTVPKTESVERDVALSDLQIAVMRVLWRQGETSVTDVAAVLAEERGLKYTTVATLLTRLEKRGVVGQRRDGRQLVYRALASEPQVRRSMVADLLGSLFGGRASGPMAGADQEAELELTVEEAYRGGRRSVSLAGPDGQRSYEVTIPPGVSTGTVDPSAASHGLTRSSTWRSRPSRR